MGAFCTNILYVLQLNAHPAILTAVSGLSQYASVLRAIMQQSSIGRRGSFALINVGSHSTGCA